MSDFQKMYTSLFNDVSEVIEHLQKAQQKTEQIYVESCVAEPEVIPRLPESEKEAGK